MSITHALQVKLEKRFSSGWSMLNAYTWQHTLGQTEENEFLEPQDTHNPAAERGDNAPDYRHQFSSAWSYELPFRPGKRFLNGTGASRWIVGRWSVKGIVAAHTGQAVTPLLSADFSSTGSGAYRPDVISDPYEAGPVQSNPDSSCAATISQGGRAADRIHTLATWYNPCAFAVPALAPGQTFSRLFGNARRAACAGPARTMSISRYSSSSSRRNAGSRIPCGGVQSI